MYIMLQDDSDLLTAAVKDSQILLTKDNTHWNWELVSTILQVNNSTVC